MTRERRPAGREVWYELTSAGRDLEPIVDALTLWGIEHAFEVPRPDEPVCAAPVMIGTKVLLCRNVGSSGKSVVWVWRFADDDSYTIRGDRAGWTLERGEHEGADVIVETTLETGVNFLTARGRRKLPQRGIELGGKPAAIAEFARAFSANSSANRAR